MKKLVAGVVSLLLLFGQTAFSLALNEDTELINTIGKKILTSNRLPDAKFTVTDSPDTFDDYFVKANVYKTVELFSWELSFAKDEGELAAIIARQIGKISNNMPTVARSQSKTNAINVTDKKGKEIMSFESKHIYSYEKLNKDKVSLAADRTAVDFLIQSGNNPLALISVYGRYLDYDEDAATERLMNIFDYIVFNFPDKVNQGYKTESYKKALEVINLKLSNRANNEIQEAHDKQAIINEKKLKQARSAFKGLNPWNASYTTLLLHK